MKGRRIPALILAILCVLILFTACSDSSREYRQASLPPETVTSAAAKTTESHPLPTAALTEEPMTAAAEDSTTEAPTEASAETALPIDTVKTEQPTAASAPEQLETEKASLRAAPTAEPEEPEPAETEAEEPEPEETEPKVTYVANTNTKKFHIPGCSSVTDMKESNKRYFTGNREELIEQGYEPCKRCKP